MIGFLPLLLAITVLTGPLVWLIDGRGRPPVPGNRDFAGAGGIWPAPQQKRTNPVPDGTP